MALFCRRCTFSARKALLRAPSETITEQLKVLSALRRQEQQTGGRSERAELTPLPGQESQRICGSSRASTVEGIYQLAACFRLRNDAVGPCWLPHAVSAEFRIHCGVPRGKADALRDSISFFSTVTTQSEAHRQSLEGTQWSGILYQSPGTSSYPCSII